MAEVTIAIPTFRRPRGLGKALEALAQLETSHAVRVLVADNDSEKREGFEICQRLTCGYRWPLDAIVVEARGIAQNRNALVETALQGKTMEYIAMFDDDEWPAPGWLDALIDVQRATGADAVAGSVVREFETSPNALARCCDGNTDVRGKTGPAPEIDSTANVLLRRECFEAERFDPAFALTGGEDRDFFTRLARTGKRFAFADEAIVHAFVPASRASLTWCLKRAYRVGNSDMRVKLKYGLGAGARAREVATIVGSVAAAPLALAVVFGGHATAANAMRRPFRAAGKVAAFLGRHYNEYAVVHGK